MIGKEDKWKSEQERTKEPKGEQQGKKRTESKERRGTRQRIRETERKGRDESGVGGGGGGGGGEGGLHRDRSRAGGSVLLRKTSIKRSRADSATINSTYKSCPVTPWYADGEHDNLRECGTLLPLPLSLLSTATPSHSPRLLYSSLRLACVPLSASARAQTASPLHPS